MHHLLIVACKPEESEVRRNIKKPSFLTKVISLVDTLTILYSYWSPKFTMSPALKPVPDVKVTTVSPTLVEESLTVVLAVSS